MTDKKENQREFVVQVYSANGEITQEGYDPSVKGMVYFDYGGGGSTGIRGESSFLVKIIASDLRNGFRKKNNIEQVRFIFPNRSFSLPHASDGYFGRPLLYVSATLLKPLPKKRRIALTREINKCHKITNNWGKEITLVA
ncbi:MAG: hypothetical protein ABIH28_01120 [archaeon]